MLRGVSGPCGLLPTAKTSKLTWMTGKAKVAHLDGGAQDGINKGDIHI